MFMFSGRSVATVYSLILLAGPMSGLRSQPSSQVSGLDCECHAYSRFKVRLFCDETFDLRSDIRSIL